MLGVRPGVLEVRASPFRISKEFINEDLPTFERPRNATSGRPSLTQWAGAKALFTNSAEVIFTFFDYKLFQLTCPHCAT